MQLSKKKGPELKEILEVDLPTLSQIWCAIVALLLHNKTCFATGKWFSHYSPNFHLVWHAMRKPWVPAAAHLYGGCQRLHICHCDLGCIISQWDGATVEAFTDTVWGNQLLWFRNRCLVCALPLMNKCVLVNSQMHFLSFASSSNFKVVCVTPTCLTCFTHDVISVQPGVCIHPCLSVTWHLCGLVEVIQDNSSTI